jgi:glycosyltransferase involved in cell wall biosynthesis
MGKLVIYNLETNLDSEVLAAAHDWISEFAKQVDEITVFSTHVGKMELPRNVHVIEIGGGGCRNRLLAMWRLYSRLPDVLRNRRDLVVFHHMSPRTLLLVGPIYRAFSVPQGLWYSHSVKSISLRLSHKLANKIFSSTAKTLPYTRENCLAIGHGINTTKFGSHFEASQRHRKGIIALGRVVPIKNLHHAIRALTNMQENARALTCIGPYDESSPYVIGLRDEAKKLNVELCLEGIKNYSEIPSIMCEFSMIFTGTPISVDKAVIEGAMCGCFVVTSEVEAQRLTGMSEIWREMGLDGEHLSIQSQISTLGRISLTRESDLRAKLSAIAISNNNLKKTTHKILNELER